MAREQQGRGWGHSQGPRGNQYGWGGTRRYQSTSPRTNSPVIKQLDLKFTPHVQGKPQAATYATVKNTVIQFIQKTFKDGNDIAQSLKDGKVYNLSKEEPEREISKAMDVTKATLEQACFDIKYQEELRHFYDRKDNLRQGLTKAYALIFSNYCNKTVKSWIWRASWFWK